MERCTCEPNCITTASQPRGLPSPIYPCDVRWVESGVAWARISRRPCLYAEYKNNSLNFLFEKQLATFNFSIASRVNRMLYT